MPPDEADSRDEVLGGKPRVPRDRRLNELREAPQAPLVQATRGSSLVGRARGLVSRSLELAEQGRLSDSSRTNGRRMAPWKLSDYRRGISVLGDRAREKTIHSAECGHAVSHLKYTQESNAFSLLNMK